MSAATQDGARAGTAPGGTPRPDRPRAEFLALGARRGHGAGLGLTFSRKQTSPSTTSAQTSKRASPRTADSNSRASPTCCGERHPSEPAARATVGKGRRPGKAPRRFLLLGGPSSRPNHHSQWERRRRGERSERLEQRRRRRAARRVPRVGRCGRPTVVRCRGHSAPPPGACPKQPPSGLRALRCSHRQHLPPPRGEDGGRHVGGPPSSPRMTLPSLTSTRLRHPKADSSGMSPDGKSPVVRLPVRLVPNRHPARAVTGAVPEGAPGLSQRRCGASAGLRAAGLRHHQRGGPGTRDTWRHQRAPEPRGSQGPLHQQGPLRGGPGTRVSALLRGRTVPSQGLSGMSQPNHTQAPLNLKLEPLWRERPLLAFFPQRS